MAQDSPSKTPISSSSSIDSEDGSMSSATTTMLMDYPRILPQTLANKIHMVKNHKDPYLITLKMSLRNSSENQKTMTVKNNKLMTLTLPRFKAILLL